MLFRRKLVTKNSPCHSVKNLFQEIGTSHSSNFPTFVPLSTHGPQHDNTPSSFRGQPTLLSAELPKEGDLVFRCHVFIFAAKYLYKTLLMFSGRRIKTCVATLEENTISTVEFTDALRIIFRSGATETTGTSGRLRTLFIEACVRWINTLNKVEEFKALLEEYPNLSIAIISNIGSCKIEEGENVR